VTYLARYDFTVGSSDQLARRECKTFAKDQGMYPRKALKHLAGDQGSGRDVGGYCRRTLLLEVLILGIECVMRAEIQRL